MELFRDVRAAAAFAPEKMKKVPLFDSARMFCDVYGLLPGQEQASHAHADADKVYFVVEGTAEFQIADNASTLIAGHAACAPAGSAHAVRNPGPGALVLLVFMAPPPR